MLIKSIIISSNIKVKQSKKPHAFFLMCPNYGNIGDIAIEHSTKKFLMQNGYDVITIIVGDLPIYAKSIKRQIRFNDIIVLQGGGSFGGLYPLADLERLFTVRYFKKNKIISFPQSITYNSKSFRSFYKKQLKTNKNVYLYFRDENSFKIATEDFNYMKDRIYLTPDIVFTLKENKTNIEQRTGCIFSIRKDIEKNIDDTLIERLKTALNKKEIKTSFYDTAVELKDISLKEELLNDLLNKYRHSKFIVTDRLHGMILSYITNTPCIAINNNNGKVKNCYDTWLNKCTYIQFIETKSEKDVLSVIEEIIKIDSMDYNYNIDKYFAPLRKNIIQ